MTGPSRPRVLCSNGCGSRTRAADGLCTDCSARLTDGTWVHHRGIQLWIPHGDTLATVAARRRYRELLTERYFTPGWFAHPGPDPDPRRPSDTDLVCARRLRDALTDADEHDHHHTGKTA